MSFEDLPEPDNMLTSDEEIAALFGVADGEPLMMSDCTLVMVISADGQIMWMSNGQTLNPEMVAKIIAFAMKNGALSSVLAKLKRSQITRSDPPTNGVSASQNTTIPGKNPGNSYNR